jgi:hypothetical protein
MKIQSVSNNKKRREFEVKTRKGVYSFPYSRLELKPCRENPVTEVFVDRELGNEGFTYKLSSGEGASIHVDAVLDFNEDPAYLTDALLYKLTVEARRRMDQSPLGTRELTRRLGTSTSQLYRLLDPTNYRKSVRQMIELLHALDCEVDFVVRQRRA